MLYHDSMIGISADRIIQLLKLLPHPEGGHYAEVFRSSLTVASPVHPGGRSASTAIYFLLQTGEFSALHRVRSEEVWHHYLGDTLEVHSFGKDGHVVERLGKNLVYGERPFVVIPANTWQAARVTTGSSASLGFALCGCTVAPGFDFTDFELPSREQLLIELAPHADLVRALTRSQS